MLCTLMSLNGSERWGPSQLHETVTQSYMHEWSWRRSTQTSWEILDLAFACRLTWRRSICLYIHTCFKHGVSLVGAIFDKSMVKDLRHFYGISARYWLGHGDGHFQGSLHCIRTNVDLGEIDLYKRDCSLTVTCNVYNSLCF